VLSICCLICHVSECYLSCVFVLFVSLSCVLLFLVVLCGFVVVCVSVRKKEKKEKGQRVVHQRGTRRPPPPLALSGGRLLARNRVHLIPNPRNSLIHNLSCPVNTSQRPMIRQRMPRVERKSFAQLVQLLRVHILRRDGDRGNLLERRLVLGPLLHRVLDVHVGAHTLLDHELEFDGFCGSWGEGPFDGLVEIVVCCGGVWDGILFVVGEDGFRRILDCNAVGTQSELEGNCREVLDLEWVPNLARRQLAGDGRGAEDDVTWLG